MASETKFCSKCETHKPVSDFPRNKARTGGLDTYCKPCGNAVRREGYQRHKSKRLARVKELRRENTERNKGRDVHAAGLTQVCRCCDERLPATEFHRCNANKRGLRYTCKHCDKLEKSDYYLHGIKPRIAEDPEFREYRNRKCREYYQRNAPELIRKQIERDAKRDPEERRAYMRGYRALRSEDPFFRLVGSMRTRTHQAVKQAGLEKKCDKFFHLLGCSVNQLREHIEAQFEEGMTWDNYGRGGWHCDHIKPCDAFDLHDEEQQRACFHYLNLQPLSEPDNLSKGAKYEANDTQAR